MGNQGRWNNHCYQSKGKLDRGTFRWLLTQFRQKWPFDYQARSRRDQWRDLYSSMRKLRAKRLHWGCQRQPYLGGTLRYPISECFGTTLVTGPDLSMIYSQTCLSCNCLYFVWQYYHNFSVLSEHKKTGEEKPKVSKTGHKAEVFVACTWQCSTVRVVPDSEV